VIDALRGVSILLVVLHHFALRVPLRKSAAADVVPHWLINALSYNGYEAVYIFFVASGFLITHHILERSGSVGGVNVGEFYARRFARIVPCLLLLLAVLSLLDLGGVQDYVIDRSRQSLPRALLSALGLHLNWYEGHTGYLPGGWDVLWSLSIEEAFYLGFPWLCRLTRREGTLAVVMGLLAISLPFTHRALRGSGIWQEKAYLPAMAAIATGVLAAIVAWRCGRIPRARMMGALGAGGILVVLTAEDILWKYTKDGGLLVLTLSTALVLVAAAQFPRTEPAVPGLLRSWGRLTYEVYLSHMFVVFALVRVFRGSGASLHTGFLWYVPLLIATWLFGAAIAKFFSLPMERRLRARLLPPPTPMAEWPPAPQTPFLQTRPVANGSPPAGALSGSRPPTGSWRSVR
jgi:peptidoglycan/LPS O-acetylase OafA/YrhL